MSIIGALVAYKGKPAKIVASTTHKYEISFSDGSSQKVREKDFRYIHPEFSNVTDQCSKADISILNDLQEDSLSLQEITEWIFDDFTSQNAWCVYLMSEDALYFYWAKDAILLRPLKQVKLIQKQRNEKVFKHALGPGFGGQVHGFFYSCSNQTWPKGSPETTHKPVESGMEKIVVRIIRIHVPVTGITFSFSLKNVGK